MASANKLEVTLSFKPLMDGLNRFTAGINQRLEQVRAFNTQIRNGDAALQRMLGQAGAVLGAAALTKFAREARDADRVQRQLVRTLERTGQTGALAALNAQAAALQKITLFGDEAVNTVQRLLISFGLTADQALAMTEAVLDFAQETGQSAEAAAMLIGRTLAGDSEELGRYKIQLDSTKGKVDALTDALRKFAAGSARGAVADPRAREIEARFADATEDLGRAVNAVAVPFLEALIPLLERISVAATAMVTPLSRITPMLGDMAAAVLPVVLALGLLSGGMKVVAMLINPLRVAIMALAGRGLLELNNSLAAVTARFGHARAAGVLLADGFTSWAGAGRLFAASLSFVSAALAGWTLGTILNELEVGGLKVKDWAAIVVLYVQDRIGGAFSSLQQIWVRVKGAWDSFQLHVRTTALEMAIAVAEAWNKLPFSKKIDTSEWQLAVGRMTAEIAGLDERTRGEIEAIVQRRARQMALNAEVLADLEKGTAAPLPAPEPDAAGAGDGRPDLNAANFGKMSAELKAREQREELERRRALFDLETAILQAQLAGNQALVDELTRQRDRMVALNQLGEESADLVEERLDVEKALADMLRQRQIAEQAHSRRIAEAAGRLALIEQSRLITQQQKDRAKVDILREMNRTIAARIALLEEEQARSFDVARQGQIDQYRQQQGSNEASIAAATPLTNPEGMIAGFVRFFDTIGTMADNLAQTIDSGLNTAMGETSTLIYNLMTGAMSFRDAWNTALLNVGQSFARMTSEMVARMLWRATVERALTALGVTTHLSGEAAKTSGTAAGSAKRLGLIAKEALADVYHGAVAAFKALAGIPIVGPILGAGALAAALALGIGLVSKIGGHASGGIVQGGKQLSWLNEEGTEAVIRAPSVRRFGEGFFERLNAGVLDLQALPASVAAQLPAASAAASRRPAGGAAAANNGAETSGPPRIYLLMDRAQFSRAMQEDSGAWFEDMASDFVRRQQS